MIKVVKWTGFILTLLTFYIYMSRFNDLLMIDISIQEELKAGDIQKDTFLEKTDFIFKWYGAFLNANGNLLLMSTLLFIGGLIAEQLASKKDE